VVENGYSWLKMIENDKERVNIVKDSRRKLRMVKNDKE
jgi:hypothetical protein